MSDTVLIVQDDLELLSALMSGATAHGHAPVPASSREQALALIERETFSAALVDLKLSGRPDGVDIIRRLKQRHPDAQVVVMSGSTSSLSELHSDEFAVYAFLHKPFELSQLFATVRRALEARRIAIDNRRLVWELRIVNEIAESVAGSLDLDVILQRTLNRVAEIYGSDAANIRLRDQLTGEFELRCLIGFTTNELEAARQHAGDRWPSDRVIASRKPVIVHDLKVEPWARAPIFDRMPALAFLTTPIFAAQELVGTLTVTSRAAGRFDPPDERLLTMIGQQLGVAVEKARFYASVQQAKAEWERTVDAISDPIAVFDADGHLVRANMALATELDAPVTEILGRTCHELGFCGGGCPNCAVGRAAHARQSSRAEITKTDGRIFAVTTIPIEKAAARISVVQVAKNVTEETRSARALRAMSHELAEANGQLSAALHELKTTQAQLVQSEKLSAIGQLVAGVAHELNNPLTSILGYTQLVQDALEGRESAAGISPHEDTVTLRSDLQRIADESERAARIVRNLLAFARRQTGERALVNVEDVVRQVLLLREYEMRLNNVLFTLDFEPGLPRICGDANQLQQTLLNLILNAEQAMSQQGRGQLDVGAAFDAEAAAIVIHVTDNGHGIDPVHLSRVFDPFFTTKPVGEGTGLGLSICYGIVRDHGGAIWAESEPGRTTFFIQLPARVYPLEPPGDVTVLVSHADPHVRDFFAAALAGWGFEALMASSPRAALEFASSGAVGVALVDRTVFEDDLAQWRLLVTHASSDPPLIFAAGGSKNDEVDRFARDYARIVVEPPFPLRALRSALRVAVQEKV